MSDERSEGLQGGVGDSGPDNLLDSFDQVIASLPPGDPIRRDLLELRPQIFDQEETMVEARRMIEKLDFFFQAEDGIRDHCVTGVQTCALPISWRCIWRETRRRAPSSRSRISAWKR